MARDIQLFPTAVPPHSHLMELVHGPVQPAHPSPFRTLQCIPSTGTIPSIGEHLSVTSAPPPTSSTRNLSWQPPSRSSPTCIMDTRKSRASAPTSFTFACPELPPSPSDYTVNLPYFIAYALYDTKLNPSVTFVSIVL